MKGVSQSVIVKIVPQMVCPEGCIMKVVLQRVYHEGCIAKGVP